MGVVFKHRGNFNNFEKFAKGYKTSRLIAILNNYGQKGVIALASATPVDSGKTAASWSYRTNTSTNSFSIIWENSNLTSTGVPVAILIQYGHGTRNGGYIQGREFINSAIRPIMDNIAEAIWQEVKGL